MNLRLNQQRKKTQTNLHLNLQFEPRAWLGVQEVEALGNQNVGGQNARVAMNVWRNLKKQRNQKTIEYASYGAPAVPSRVKKNAGGQNAKGVRSVKQLWYQRRNLLSNRKILQTLTIARAVWN